MIMIRDQLILPPLLEISYLKVIQCCTLSGPISSLHISIIILCCHSSLKRNFNRVRWVTQEVFTLSEIQKLDYMSACDSTDLDNQDSNFVRVGKAHRKAPRRPLQCGSRYRTALPSQGWQVVDTCDVWRSQSDQSGSTL